MGFGLLVKKTGTKLVWTSPAPSTKPTFQYLGQLIDTDNLEQRHPTRVSAFGEKRDAAMRTPLAIRGLKKQVEGHDIRKLPNIANLINKHRSSATKRPFPPIHLSAADGEHINLATLKQAEEYHDSLMYRANELHNAHEEIDRKARKAIAKLKEATLGTDEYQTALDTYESEMKALEDGIDEQLKVIVEKHHNSHAEALIDALESIESRIAVEMNRLLETSSPLGTLFTTPARKPFRDRIAIHATEGKAQLKEIPTTKDDKAIPIDDFEAQLKAVIDLRVAMCEYEADEGLKATSIISFLQTHPAMDFELKIDGTAKAGDVITHTLKWDGVENKNYDLYSLNLDGSVSRTKIKFDPNTDIKKNHLTTDLTEDKYVGYAIVRVVNRPKQMQVPTRVVIAKIAAPTQTP